MSVADNNRLIALAQKGDNDAITQLMENNAPLIWSIVRRFFGRGVESDDLFQLGSMGFFKAIMGFDPSYGTCFSTYAVPKIAGEIKRFIRDDGMLKVSRTLKEQNVRINAARAFFEKTNGCEARVSDLCALTGLESEEIAVCAQSAVAVASLEEPRGDDGICLMDMLPGDSGDTMIEHMSLRQAVDKLDERRRSVILLRYFRDLTQQKTAKALDMSQVQVSRMEKSAIKELKAMML